MLSGCDFVLLSISPEEKVDPDKLRAISEKNHETPVLIKKGSKIYLYGFSDTWNITELDSKPFRNISFPETTDETWILDSSDVKKEMSEEITSKKAHDLLSGEMFSDVYNRFTSDPEFKNQTKRTILIANLSEKNKLSIEMQKKIKEYKENFTMEKLSQCKNNYFSPYVKKYGDKQPFHTSYKWINKGGNYVISCSPLKLFDIHTNQHFNKSIVDIIEEAEENKEKKHIIRTVLNALIKIKDVDDKMIKKNISGEVRKRIKETLDLFELDIPKADFKKQVKEVSALIDYIQKPSKRIHKNSRIKSPILERELLKLY